MSKGVLGMVAAAALFGTLFYYVTLMKPLTGEEIFGWRMIFTAPFVTVFLMASGQWHLARATIAQVHQRPLLLLGVLLCAVMVGTNFWLFLWAPGEGRALETSLGYFLMPLVLVLIGRFVYGERLTLLQVGATLLAAAGVTNEILQVGKVSWPTLVVALGYPLYFVLRRRFGTHNLGGAWLEMQLMVPAAVLFVLTGPTLRGGLTSYPDLFLLIPGLGAISALALSLHYIASRILTFGLFGLLSYLEPVFLVFVALILGEGIAPHQWFTYVPIWCAVGLLVVEGMVTYVASRRSSVSGRAAAR